MASIINAIIAGPISNPRCEKLLARDGILTPDLSIKRLYGIFDEISIVVKTAKTTLPCIGETASIAKNLDEYQYRICQQVPSMPDSDPLKIELQKYRIVTITAFAKLVPLLIEGNLEKLKKWNIHAKKLLVDVSAVNIKSKSRVNSDSMQNGEMTMESFAVFGIAEYQLESALRMMYGIDEQKE